MLARHEVLRSPAALAAWEEERLAAAHRFFAEEHAEWCGGVMAVSAAGTGADAWPNSSVNAGMNGEMVIAEDVRRLVSWFGERRVVPTIEVGPYAHDSLLKELGAAGFVATGFEHCLVFDLGAALPEMPAVEGLRFERADRSRAEVEPWSADICEVHAEGSPVIEAKVLAAERAIEHERSVALDAFVGDEWAGGCAHEVYGDGACMFFGAVSEAFRRRGIQQAMTVERLRRAKDAGCAFAVIGSLPNGPTERNALRLGGMAGYARMELKQPAV